MLPSPAEHLLSDAALVAGLLSAEVSHELTQTLNFLRYLLSHTPKGAASETDGFAQTEIERLSRLLGHLRAFKLRSPAMMEIMLATLLKQYVAQAESAATRASTVLGDEVAGEIWVRAAGLQQGAADAGRRRLGAVSELRFDGRPAAAELHQPLGLQRDRERYPEALRRLWGTVTALRRSRRGSI